MECADPRQWEHRQTVLQTQTTVSSQFEYSQFEACQRPDWMEESSQNINLAYFFRIFQNVLVTGRRGGRPLQECRTQWGRVVKSSGGSSFVSTKVQSTRHLKWWKFPTPISDVCHSILGIAERPAFSNLLDSTDDFKCCWSKSSKASFSVHYEGLLRS